MKKVFKFIFFLITLFVLPLSVVTGKADWVSGENGEAVGTSTIDISPIDSKPQAYIAGSTKQYFYTIESALEKAESGNIVVVIPATKKNYNDASNPVKANTLDKPTYTISEDCTIKSGVTLIIPTDKDSVDGVVDASSLATYISSMDNPGTTQGNGGYGYFAIDNSSLYQRVSVSIANGKTLYNYGTLVVSGYLNGGVSGASVEGQTSHSYSQIVLGTNSKISQSNNGKMYVYGYILEATNNNSSNVILENGSLYIPFILDDYRGFNMSWAYTYSNSQALNTYRCSPFNQFEIKNIYSLTTIKYSCNVIGVINLRVVYSTLSIDEVFHKEVNIVGSGSSNILQFTNSSYSKITNKYNISTGISTLNIYGGMKLNNISISMSASVMSVSLSTSNSYLPLSYRYNVNLLSEDAQASATFDLTSQRLKVLPGGTLSIGNKCTLNGNSICVYSSFLDGSNGNGKKSECANSKAYPIKNGGQLVVNVGGTLSASSIAGIVYGDSSSVTASTSNITCYEGWSVVGSGATPIQIASNGTPAWKIGDYLEIIEQLEIHPITDLQKKKLYVGLNTFKEYDSYKPRFDLNVDTGLSTANSFDINGVQKVLFFDSITNYSVVLKQNIYKMMNYDTYYTKNTTITFNNSKPNLTAVNSIVSINSNNSGTNEFNVQSITVNCTTPLIDGNIPLYVGSEVNLEAVIVDTNKVYDRTKTWSSSNNSIATVDSNGTVTGVALGSVRITCTSDGVSGYIDLNVIQEIATESISSITLSDNAGNSSTKVVKTKNNADYHAKYNKDTNHTVSLNINPSSAPWKSINWTFKTENSGRGSITNAGATVNGATSTISDVTSVTINITGDAGWDDYDMLTCVVVDFNDNEFTCKFGIIHVGLGDNDEGGSCVLPYTMVTLADGSRTEIKNLQQGDLIRVFNHETGQLDVAPIVFNEKDEEQLFNVIHLEFSNGADIGVISEHGFFDLDTMKYEYIDESNFNDFVGHRFYTEGGSTTVLTNAYIQEEYTACYELPSYYHLNFFAEGILSMPGGIKGLFNIFDYGENLQYDQEKMQQDIETYGLFTYEDLAPYGVTEIMFDCYAGKYLKVALGKGILTWEYLKYLINRYSKYTE